jgi:hypothetical protein
MRREEAPINSLVVSVQGVFMCDAFDESEMKGDDDNNDDETMIVWDEV